MIVNACTPRESGDARYGVEVPFACDFCLVLCFFRSDLIVLSESLMRILHGERTAAAVGELTNSAVEYCIKSSEVRPHRKTISPNPRPRHTQGWRP